MACRDLRSQRVRGDAPSHVALETKGASDPLPEERVAERGEHQPQGAFRDMMFLMPDPQLGDEAADGIQDRIERVAVSGQDHPGGKGAGAFAVEGVERAVDDFADVPFAAACALHCLGDAARDPLGDGQSKLSLKAGGRSEMMKQIGVGPADLSCNGLERHRLRTLFEQQPPRGFQRGGAAFPGVQAFTAY